MRLRDFIKNNTRLIVEEWQEFAKTLLPAAEHMTAFALRDHIEAILHDIVVDMDQAQSSFEQEAKSKGEQTTAEGLPDSAAQAHASGRVESGFNLEQLTSEFRALRASIIRLWIKHDPVVDSQNLDDLIRFNETIDQALTESVTRFSQQLEQSRELFLGILGHDLRNPLQAIIGSAGLLPLSTDLKKHANLSKQIITSANRINHLINDLLELTRVRLGKGISIQREDIDLRALCIQVLDEMKAVYPDTPFRLDMDHGIDCQWDQARISQVLSNLLGNAVQHGAAGKPVTVAVQQTGTDVKIQVHNEGPPVPSEAMKTIFMSFVQGLEQIKQKENAATSLGLGLYIAKEIVTAHGGTIDVSSSITEGTTFTVCIPCFG